MKCPLQSKIDTVTTEQCKTCSQEKDWSISGKKQLQIEKSCCHKLTIELSSFVRQIWLYKSRVSSINLFFELVKLVGLNKIDPFQEQNKKIWQLLENANVNKEYIVNEALTQLCIRYTLQSYSLVYLRQIANFQCTIMAIFTEAK